MSNAFLSNMYQKVLEKLLRPGTRRRYYYELGLTGIRVIRNEGWRVLKQETGPGAPQKIKT